MDELRNLSAQCRANELGRWVASLAMAGSTLIGVTTAASAETATPPASMPSIRAERRLTGIHLDAQSGWSVGLEGYAGLATLSTVEGTKGHAMAGGVSRARFGFVEIGAGVEASDDAGERWRNVGGFVGAYVPFTNWVDVDATVGLSLRNYVSTDTRYGPVGVTAKVPALTLRLGVSDRTIAGLIGPRIGAALLFGIDLKERDVTWAYEMAGTASAAGVSHFGGVTAGLVMSFGFDLTLRSDR